jgi:hypothetical protein
MGLIKDTQNTYYTGNDFGSYQFTSLDDIITQFEIAYVGENKIIPKIKRADIAFHAMRALQELSFDTFKSVKAHQIDLPPSLTMILPHDYVNYTKLSWVDSAGIKHPLYSTNSTSNPFQIKQEDNGDYFFGVESERLVNFDFSDPLADTWSRSLAKASHAWSATYANTNLVPKYHKVYIDDTIGLNSGVLEFNTLWSSQGGGRAYGAWQRVDTSFDSTLELRAIGSSGDRIMGNGTDHSSSTIICDYGIVRVGVTTTDPSVGWGGYNATAHTSTWSNSYDSPNDSPTLMDLGYVEWSDGSSSQKELLDIDVTNYSEVWIWTTSTSPFTASANTLLTSGVVGGEDPIEPEQSVYNTHQKNTVDEISVIMPGNLQVLSSESSDGNSSTWNNYKSNTPSENNNDDYEDDTYWPANGERYGLDPQHAQANGSFYIDNRLGKINFSSNISGKTVILDYISDSLGTDAEMQVHKFAEDAMYKWIAHAILSTSSYGQGLVRRLTREKFAATRKAKLRLSNIKLEELTQILRGKSKQIKH